MLLTHADYVCSACMRLAALCEHEMNITRGGAVFFPLFSIFGDLRYEKWARVDE